MGQLTYVPGHSIEEAQQASGRTKIVKAGSNENALGPSPKAQAAMQCVLAEVHLYPDQHESALRQKLAYQLGGGFTEDNFVSGNGSCDVLRMITQTFIRPGDKALITAPTFPMFQLLTRLFGGDPVFVPLQNYAIDLDAVMAAIDEDVKLVFLCNPNNPTGTIVSHGQMADFLLRVPSGVVTVCDEAYMEFSDDPTFPYMEAFVEESYAVLVTRTFSKLHGLASLRIGYGFGREDLIASVRQRQMPFNSGRLAYLAAGAAMDDEEHIDNSLEMVRNGREYFYSQFDKMGIRYLPTQSNFILLSDLPLDAGAICDEAMKQGVVLRPTGQFGLPDGIRITFARQADNERIIETLAGILGR